MTQDNTSLLWQTKVAGRLHDPAEKALVLLRDPAGHENGTSRALSRLLGLHELTADTVDADGDDALAHTLFPDGIQKTMYRHVQHADWWAAAADRPQWPMETISVQTAKGEKSLRIAPWAQVRWTSKPELKHPLTGECYDMGKHGGLSDTDFGDIKDRSFDVFNGPIVDNDGQQHLAAGATADDDWMGKIDFYVKGIDGKVPASR